MSRLACLAFLALLPALLLSSQRARAQTISPSGQMFPHRIVGGMDLGESTRPQNLTPLGISYSDCIQDMTLSFDVLVSGFTGADTLQIWATKSGTCTDPTSRGVGGNSVITCWLLASGLAGAIVNTTTPETFNIRVQDLVGPQNQTGLMNANYVRQGPEACSSQPTFVAVPMTIWFMAVNSSGSVDGNPYSYQVATDLLGPPAPSGVMAGVGDTLLALNWTPNADSDTTGYDVFLDPIPGMEDASPAVSADATATLVCPEAGASAPGQDASTEGGQDGAADADDGSVSDATSPSPNAFTGCYYVGGSANGSPGGAAGSDNCNNSCTSTVLTGGIVQDGGTVIETDEAGNPIEGGASSGSGGLSTIPSNYLVGVNSSAGVTVADKNTGSYTVTGLVDGMPGYTAVVAAVDGFGNIGPPSAEACGCPAVVNDFWSFYKMAGGQSGGGCALEAVGQPGPALSSMALIATATALARRRRGNRRERHCP